VYLGAGAELFHQFGMLRQKGLPARIEAMLRPDFPDGYALLKEVGLLGGEESSLTIGIDIGVSPV